LVGQRRPRRELTTIASPRTRNQITIWCGDPSRLMVASVA